MYISQFPDPLFLTSPPTGSPLITLDKVANGEHVVKLVTYEQPIKFI